MSVIERGEGAFGVEERKRRSKGEYHAHQKKIMKNNEKQLTWLIVVSVAVPALGLLFAWQTYGTLWG